MPEQSLFEVMLKLCSTEFAWYLEFIMSILFENTLQHSEYYRIHPKEREILSHCLSVPKLYVYQKSSKTQVLMAQGEGNRVIL